jgi:3-oxoacyl-[acyl-carrier-protein] synthase-3
MPSSAAILHGMLSLPESCAAFDINAACSGFLYGLNIARSVIASGGTKYVLLVGSDKMSSILDFADRSTAVLFGDGAAAVIVSRSDTMSDVIIRASGKAYDALGTYRNSDNEHRIFMNGKEVYRNAVTKMCEVSYDIMHKHAFSSDDIDFFIPHQANINIINSIALKLGFSDSKVVRSVSEHANTSAASIPLAISTVYSNGGDSGRRCLIAAIGAGLVWGACLISI